MSSYDLLDWANRLLFRALIALLLLLSACSVGPTMSDQGDTLANYKEADSANTGSSDDVIKTKWWKCMAMPS